MAKAQGVRLWLVRLFKIGAFSAAAGLIALVAAVIVAMQSLPSYESLKSSPNGQMIRVHAADGSVIVSLGPSFGRWLTIDQIPQVMKDAMVSVEDKRFYYHPGVDPVGMARAGWFAIQHRGTGRRLQGASTITSSSPATSSSTTAIPSDARRGR
jgi:penicillin-binding protein 1A